MSEPRRAASMAAVWTFVFLAAGCVGSPGPVPTPPPGGDGLVTVEAPIQWDLDWARGAVFYEVFVRSFADSDGDGVGDLAGLTARLDYLNDGDPKTETDLEIDGLWLMPVSSSPSYHGYDVVDYDVVDGEYGSGEDLERFLAEAHRRGIRVIVDLVVNHTSSEHPWFLESASSPASSRRDWYVWRPDDPGWTQPWGGSATTWHRSGHSYYYGIFWSGMPDLEWRNRDVRAEMARIAIDWLRRGVDGFRLDATRHLVANGPGQLQNDQPETHAYLKEFSARIREARPDALLVGENWTDTETIATYYGDTDVIRGGDELPASFDFPLAAAIVETVRTGDSGSVERTLVEIERAYPEGALDAPFLTNHDQIRIATRLAGDPGALGTAASILLTLPGIPFLYYGEEVGLANGPGRDDREKRTPMPWSDMEGGGFTEGEPWHSFAPGRVSANVAAQTADPGSLLSRYRWLVRVRHRSPALMTGELVPVKGSEAEPALLAYLRVATDQTVLVAHGVGPEPLGFDLPDGYHLGEPLFSDPGVEASDGRVRLPPGATGIWVVTE